MPALSSNRSFFKGDFYLNRMDSMHFFGEVVQGLKRSIVVSATSSACFFGNFLIRINLLFLSTMASIFFIFGRFNDLF